MTHIQIWRGSMAGSSRKSVLLGIGTQKNPQPALRSWDLALGKSQKKRWKHGPYPPYPMWPRCRSLGNRKTHAESICDTNLCPAIHCVCKGQAMTQKPLQTEATRIDFRHILCIYIYGIIPSSVSKPRKRKNEKGYII